MGGCCSCHVSLVGKVHDEEYECSSHHNVTAFDRGGALITLGGSSRFTSMYTQQGTKGINQDAMTVWEDFAGEKDMIFCGVFDGHGPEGHKFSQCIRDNLPSKLSAAIKLPQQNAAGTGSYDVDVRHLSFASWEGKFLRSFREMDEDLARNFDSSGLSGGSTAVTVIKQGDHLIVGNLGDSRAVLCTRADDNHLIPVQLTVDLIPDIPSETLRILNCGGRIFASGEDPGLNRIWMPESDCPGLAMSRAFGDFCLKDYGLSSVPEVSYRKLTKQDEFVVLATDGVWHVLTNNEVINIVASAPKRSMAAKLLVTRAVQAWRLKYPCYHVDDCAAICLFLNDQYVLTYSQSGMRGSRKQLQ